MQADNLLRPIRVLSSIIVTYYRFFVTFVTLVISVFAFSVVLYNKRMHFCFLKLIYIETFQKNE